MKNSMKSILLYVVAIVAATLLLIICGFAILWSIIGQFEKEGLDPDCRRKCIMEGFDCGEYDFFRKKCICYNIEKEE